VKTKSEQLREFFGQPVDLNTFYTAIREQAEFLADLESALYGNAVPCNSSSGNYTNLSNSQLETIAEYCGAGFTLKTNFRAVLRETGLKKQRARERERLAPSPVKTINPADLPAELLEQYCSAVRKS